MIWYKSGMGDPNLIPSNIKKGVSIFGRLGTFEGYVPEATDIYWRGSWGTGYSSSDIVRIGGSATPAADVRATAFVYNTTYIDIQETRYRHSAVSTMESNVQDPVWRINRQYNFTALTQFLVAMYSDQGLTTPMGVTGYVVNAVPSDMYWYRWWTPSSGTLSQDSIRIQNASIVLTGSTTPTVPMDIASYLGTGYLCVFDGKMANSSIYHRYCTKISLG